MDVDYDTYAEGEAELGWLNCQVHLNASEDNPFSLDPVLVDLVRELRAQLAEVPAEPAHLKVLGQPAGTAEQRSPDTVTAIANLVDSEGDVELSVSSSATVDRANLIVNARVATSPELLEEVVERSVERTAGRHGVQFEVKEMQRFRPGRPVPTHRMS